MFVSKVTCSSNTVLRHYSKPDGKTKPAQNVRAVNFLDTVKMFFSDKAGP